MQKRGVWTGLFLGVSATVGWGLFPLYWKQLGAVAPVEQLCHKILWSFVVAAIFITLQRRWGEIRQFASRPRRLVWFLISGILITLNGFAFIYTVASGHVIESSLGYYLTPLACVALGTLILRERLRILQWTAVFLGIAGVMWLTFGYGHFPWLAMILCLSFGSYGLVRKIAPADSLMGFFWETLFFSPVAAGVIIWLFLRGAGSFVYAGERISLLLCLAGLVTALPRLWFAAAARRISMTSLGILEYTTPTLMFVLSVFTYHEHVTANHIIAFSLIWTGIGLYTIEPFTRERGRQWSKALSISSTGVRQ